MKKISLLILLLTFSTISACAYFTYNFEFKLIQDDKTKICQAFEDGYVCNGEEPVYYENFKETFIPLKVNYWCLDRKDCLRLNQGHQCIDEKPVFWFKGQKGILIKDSEGKEQICALKRDGSYECPQNDELYSMLLPYGNWEFIREEGFWKVKYTQGCIGYKNGYICTGEEPRYIKDFRNSFDFSVSEQMSNDMKVKNGIPLYKNCYELKLGYYCTGEMPVINKVYKIDEHRGIFVPDKSNPGNKKICKNFTLDEYIDSGYKCKGEEPVITKRPTKVKYTGKYKFHGKVEEMRKGIIANYGFVTCNQYKDGSVYCPGEENNPKKYAMTYDLTPEEFRKAKAEAERNKTEVERLKESLNKGRIYMRDKNGNRIEYKINPYTTNRNTLELIPRWSH